MEGVKAQSLLRFVSALLRSSPYLLAGQVHGLASVGTIGISDLAVCRKSPKSLYWQCGSQHTHHPLTLSLSEDYGRPT